MQGYDLRIDNVDYHRFTMFDSILTTLLALNQLTRPLVRDHLPRTWMTARDFCTVSFDTGQRSGKTTWLHTKSHADDLLVVPDINFVKWSKDAGVTNVCSIDELDTSREYRNIYVDAAGCYGREKRIAVLSLFSNFDQTFIFVG